jgi:hypothetical protein
MPHFTRSQKSPSRRRDAGTGRTPVCDADPSLSNMDKKEAQDCVNGRLKKALKKVAGHPPLVQKPHHGAHEFSRPLLHLGLMDYRNAGRYYQRVCASVSMNFLI